MHLTEEATVFAIKQLADRAAQVVFGDFGTFMLERTVRSLIDPDGTPRIGSRRKSRVT